MFWFYPFKKQTKQNIDWGLGSAFLCFVQDVFQTSVSTNGMRDNLNTIAGVCSKGFGSKRDTYI